MLTVLRIAFRRLANAPVFTSTAVATLAICIAANLTIFAVVDALFIRSLPFPHADRLVTMYYLYPKMPSAVPGASITNYYERRGKIPAIQSLSAINENTSVIGESGSTSIEELGRVTPEFFRTLGVPLFLGRAFSEAEMTYLTDHEAIISYEYWRSAYGSDPSVIGKIIRMDGDRKKIVGVLPPRFRFLSFRAPVYMPLSTEESERNVGARHAVGTILIGRLAPGATLAQAQAQIDGLDAALAPLFPDAKLIAEAGTHTVVAPLQSDFVASVRPMFILLQAAAIFLLAIGGANLVNLLLIRASNRSREIAIRQALGAGRRQIIADVVAETMLLSLGGALAGLWLGAVAIHFLGLLGADQLPLGAEITFNPRVAEASLLLAALVGVGIAIPGVWFNLQNRLAVALNAQTRGGTSGSTALRLRRCFIVSQVALSFVLLAGAGLLGLSLRRAMAVAPGFRADHVITGQFNLTWHGYPVLDSFHKFFDRLSDQTAALPGITAVGAATAIPVGPSGSNVMTVRGYAPKGGEAAFLVHDAVDVAGDYFAAMGIPLVSGRFLRPSDSAGKELTCVVDEAFARQYWPDGSAIGKELSQGVQRGPNVEYFRIVGVVGTVKQSNLTERKSRGTVYFPYGRDYARQYYLVARTSLAPEFVANMLIQAVRATDADVPLTHLRTMELRLSDSLSGRRSPALMAGIFAAAALLLAAVGLYGVMAYAVAQRIREFGVRMALGAQSLDVLRLVFLEGVRLAGIGLAVGLVLALVLTRFLASDLYGVRPNDPLALAGVAVLISLVVCFACLLPARRATKVDPMVALRAE
ncbi:MAG TPA: ABC transporter permease [Opitutaceae bacterium]|jgi:predicted permease